MVEMNSFKKWLRICLAGVIVILKLAHYSRLLLCVFVTVCTFEKYYLNNLAVLYFKLFTNLDVIFIIVYYSISMFLFRDFIEILIGSSRNFLYSSGYFLIYIACAFLSINVSDFLRNKHPF